MKKLLLLSIVILLVVSSSTIAFGQLVDYENSWAKNEIDYMREKGIIVGYPDGTFRPTNNMSKSEFYKVINGLMGYTEKAEVEFKDVTTADWYYEEVQKGVNAKYILSSETLNARDNITREEVARILSVVFCVEKDEAAAEEFTDNALFSEELKGVIGGLKKNGFVNGLPDGSFNPKGEITRAEVVKMLHNISGEIVNVAGTVSKDVKTNLVVNTADVVLKDMTVEGNLYLTEGIGEGDVTLDNVVVKGQLSVNGGGANSIIIKNSKLNKVVVDKQQGLVRVVLENTIAEEVKTSNEVKLEITTGTEINSVKLDGKVEVAMEKGATIIVVDVVGKDIVIESKGAIEFLISQEEVKVNGKTVSPNTEIKVDAGKVAEVKPEPETKNEDDYYERPSEPSEPSKPNKDDIIARYKKELESLQKTTESKLKDLAGEAIEEYMGSSGDKSEIVNKYKDLAKDLEAETDNGVSSILSELEKELQSNGYDTDAISDLNSEYEKIKSDTEGDYRNEYNK